MSRESVTNRRRFLRTVGAVGAGTVLAGCSGGDGGSGGGSTEAATPESGNTPTIASTDSDGETEETEVTPTEEAQMSPEEWRKMAAEKAKAELSGNESLKFFTQQHGTKFVNSLTKDHEFEEPWGVLTGNVEPVQGASDQMLERYLRQLQQGEKMDMEVCNFSHMGIMLAEADGVPFASLSDVPSFRDLPDAVKWEDFRATYYVRIYTNPYNTDLVSEVPHNFDDLLKPAFADQKIIWDFTPGAGAVVPLMLQKKGRKYVEQLAEQEVIMQGSTFATTQKVAQGDAHVGFQGLMSHTVEFRNEGNPIDFPEPTDTFIYAPGPLFLSKRPKHPWAGKLYIDWILSHPEYAINGLNGVISSDLEIFKPDSLRDVFDGPEAVTIGPRLARKNGTRATQIVKEMQLLMGAPV